MLLFFETTTSVIRIRARSGVTVLLPLDPGAIAIACQRVNTQVRGHIQALFLPLLYSRNPVSLAGTDAMQCHTEPCIYCSCGRGRGCG
jgi:hypothetical protein